MLQLLRFGPRQSLHGTSARSSALAGSAIFLHLLRSGLRMPGRSATDPSIRWRCTGTGRRGLARYCLAPTPAPRTSHRRPGRMSGRRAPGATADRPRRQDSRRTCPAGTVAGGERRSSETPRSAVAAWSRRIQRMPGYSARLSRLRCSTSLAVSGGSPPWQAVARSRRRPLQVGTTSGHSQPPAPSWHCGGTAVSGEQFLLPDCTWLKERPSFRPPQWL